MSVWDIASILGIIILLGGAWWLLRRLDQRARLRSRDRAYKLLDMDNPSVKDMKATIRELQLYGGRLRHNKEFQQLRHRLTQKLDGIESSSAK